MMRYFIWYQQPNPRNQGKLGADVLVLCKCFSKSWVTNAKKTCLVNGFGVGGEEVIRLSLPSVFFFIAFSAFLCVINSCMIIDCPYPCSYCSFIPFFSSLFIGGHCPFPHPPLRSPYTPMPHRLSSRAHKKPQKQTNSFPIDFLPLEIWNHLRWDCRILYALLKLR